MALPAAVSASREQDSAFIALEGVGKTFDTGDGEVTAIEAATLNIRRGETVALIGPGRAGTTIALGLMEQGWTVVAAG